MLRAYPCDGKAKDITRGKAAFHISFPTVSNSEIFVPQQQTGAARETEIGAPSGRFICAELKVSRGADRGVYNVARQENALQT